jgi:cytochrome c
LLISALVAFASNALAGNFKNIGRVAIDKEVAAWDIDVRPDFKGLPTGSGNVALGQQVWDEKCASCHGSFGELNEVFTPIVGGTTREDVKIGRVAALSDNKQPQRTTLMKVSNISTLWDYINRAMPWTAPKSLTANEVYAVTAYILYLGEIVPDDFTLSNKNIKEAQALIPNRNGMTLDHGMRTVLGKPDVKSNACMSNCLAEDKIRSSLPDVSRDAHGNLQQQNRHFGAVRGVDTTKPVLIQPVGDIRRIDLTLTAAVVKSDALSNDPVSLSKKYACIACHGINNKIVGPSFVDVAARYKGNAAADKLLVERIRNGSAGNWSNTPMPAQTAPSDIELSSLVNWILSGAK